MTSAKTTLPCETRETALARASALPMESRCLEMIASTVGLGSFALHGMKAAKANPKAIDACRAVVFELIVFIDRHGYFEWGFGGGHTPLYIADLELDIAVDLRFRGCC